MKKIALIAALVLLAGCAVVQQKPTIEVAPIGVTHVEHLYPTAGATNIVVQTATNILGPWTTVWTTTNQPSRIDVVDHGNDPLKFYRLVYP